MLSLIAFRQQKKKPHVSKPYRYLIPWQLKLFPLLNLWSLRKTNILFLLTISALNHPWRSQEKKEMITNSRSSWLLNKFSLSAPQEMCKKQKGEYAYWCYGVGNFLILIFLDDICLVVFKIIWCKNLLQSVLQTLKIA